MKFLEIALDILKDAVIKACVCFTSIIIIINIISVPLSTQRVGLQLNMHVEGWLTSSLVFMFALASFLIGAAAQVFKIAKLPKFSRQIIFFILSYGIFIIIVIPMSNHQISPDSTLLLSVAFIIIYLVIFGIRAGIRAALRSAANKKSDYEAVYKN